MMEFTRVKWQFLAIPLTVALLGLLIAVVQPAGASEGEDASASITRVEGCPPWKSLTSGQVMRTCPGEHPVNCLKRPRQGNLQVQKCGYEDLRYWADLQYYWGCGLEESDCYPRQCKREVSNALTFLKSAESFLMRIPVPITSPGAVPQAMILEKISDNTLALLFTQLWTSANHNVNLTCGDATNDAYWEAVRKIQKASRPYLSISIGRGILFASSKADAAAKYADLIGRAVTVQATRKDGYSVVSAKQSFGFGFGNGEIKQVESVFSASPTGRVSLRISLKG